MRKQQSKSTFKIDSMENLWQFSVSTVDKISL